MVGAPSYNASIRERRAHHGPYPHCWVLTLIVEWLTNNNNNDNDQQHHTNKTNDNDQKNQHTNTTSKQQQRYDCFVRYVGVSYG